MENSQKRARLNFAAGRAFQKDDPESTMAESMSKGAAYVEQEFPGVADFEQTPEFKANLKKYQAKFKAKWQIIKAEQQCSSTDAMSKAASLHPDLYKKQSGNMKEII